MPCSVDQVLSDLQYPVVVKPNKGRSAEGLAFLYEPSRVSDAVAYAGKYDNAILFQEMVEGRDFRILVLDGEPLVLIERGVRTLQGDGVSSVSQLVAGSRVHESVASKPGELISLQSYVEAFGDTIVEKGFVIKIHPASNLALGGSVLDCHLEVSNIWKKLCRCVSRCLPLRFFALDCRGDPDVADRLFVLEVNANPGIEFLYRHSRQTGDRIVDILVEKALAASKQ